MAERVQLAEVFPPSRWSLVGGLMVQGHAMTHRIEAERPTADLDVILHIEVDPTVAIDAGGRHYRFSVPDELGALVLKGAAYTVDSRDTERHLFDAAVLAACISDLPTQIGRLRGSDRLRIKALAQALQDPRHPAWLALPTARRVTGQDNVRLLGSDPPPAALSQVPEDHRRAGVRTLIRRAAAA